MLPAEILKFNFAACQFKDNQDLIVNVTRNGDNFV